MSKQIQPSPSSVLVCGVCGEPWTTHMSRAEGRLLDREDYELRAGPTQDEITVEVNLLDCIAALKNANRGPSGPPGPVGATGAKGAPA